MPPVAARRRPAAAISPVTRQQRRVLARVIGARVGRVDAVVGRHDQQVARAQARRAAAPRCASICAQRRGEARARPCGGRRPGRSRSGWRRRARPRAPREQPVDALQRLRVGGAGMAARRCPRRRTGRRSCRRRAPRTPASAQLLQVAARGRRAARSRAGPRCARRRPARPRTGRAITRPDARPRRSSPRAPPRRRGRAPAASTRSTCAASCSTESCEV